MRILMVFTFYDVDFSFGNHLHGVKCGVIFDVKLTHKSIGQTNDEWESHRIDFVEKYSFMPNTDRNLVYRTVSNLL